MKKELILWGVFLLTGVSLEEIFAQTLFNIGTALSNLMGLLFLFLIPIGILGLIKETCEEFSIDIF